MGNQTYGYARFSTKEQNLVRQIVAMRAFGIQDELIFQDKESEKDFNRRQYRRLIRRLKREIQW